MHTTVSFFTFKCSIVFLFKHVRNYKDLRYVNVLIFFESTFGVRYFKFYQELCPINLFLVTIETLVTFAEQRVTHSVSDLAFWLRPLVLSSL